MWWQEADLHLHTHTNSLNLIHTDELIDNEISLDFAAERSSGLTSLISTTKKTKAQASRFSLKCPAGCGVFSTGSSCLSSLWRWAEPSGEVGMNRNKELKVSKASGGHLGSVWEKQPHQSANCWLQSGPPSCGSVGAPGEGRHNWHGTIHYLQLPFTAFDHGNAHNANRTELKWAGLLGANGA